MHVGANQTTLRIGLNGLRITPDTVALDMACAVGGNARWLASLYGCRVYGNDIDEPALAVARDLAEIEQISHLCTFVNARADRTGFSPNFFDIVVSTDVFDVPEVRRVLKPGGRFAVSMLTTDTKATPESLASQWGMELELAMDVTGMALAFQRAKEEEAGLLVRAGMVPPRAIVEMYNESIAPYIQGGRHLLMRVRKPG
jgi:ubiquinone/menaquinone biosynthesis C-methylase UbiE